MTNVNSRKWILIFLFYGIVCFCFGFFGYLSNQGRGRFFPQKTTTARLKHPNLLVQSEKYLSSWLADLIMPNSQDTVVPAFSDTSTGRLYFCYPSQTELPLFHLVIQAVKSDFAKHFPITHYISIAKDELWESSLVSIWKDEPQSIVIGVNVISQKPESVTIHLYVSVPDNWREKFLPTLEKHCHKLNTFLFSKRRLNNRDLYRVTWEDNRNQFTKNLELMMNDLTKKLRPQRLYPNELI